VWITCFFFFLCLEPPGSAEEAGRLMESRRFDLALGLIEKLLEAPEGQAPSPGGRKDLRKLHARCLFELGDYPACEKELRSLLEMGGLDAPERLECLVHLAQVLSFQQTHGEALQVVEQALARENNPAIHRLGITIALRAHLYQELSAHAEAILAADPKDPMAHFGRGIARAREGRFQEALADLEWGFKLPGARRDAHFETALVHAKLKKPREALSHLLEILQEDPLDEEACYQAARQLLLTGDKGAVRTAAHLTSYLEGIKKAAGPSSRDHHFEAAGQAAAAALQRAAKWERLGSYERALPELSRAETLSRGNTAVLLGAADFWARMGLLAEAERILADFQESVAGRDAEAAEAIRGAQGQVSARKAELREKAKSPATRAEWELAQVSWRDAVPALEKLLAAAEAEAPALARRAAGVLLARDPRSRKALEHMVKSTADPALIVQRLHFLARLAEVAPSAPAREELDRLKLTFLGSSPPAGR
jgi:tetratricopeptide (TPR) repeat protein